MSAATQIINGIELIKGSLNDAFIKYKMPTLGIVTDWTMPGTIVAEELLRSGRGPATETWSDSKPYDPSYWDNYLEFTSGKGSKLYTNITSTSANNNGYIVNSGYFNLSTDPNNKTPSDEYPLYFLTSNFETISRVDTNADGYITRRAFTGENNVNFNRVNVLTTASELSPENIFALLNRETTADFYIYDNQKNYNSYDSQQMTYYKDGYYLTSSFSSAVIGSFEGSLDADPMTLVVTNKLIWNIMQLYVFTDKANEFEVNFSGNLFANQVENSVIIKLNNIRWMDGKAGYQIIKTDAAVTLNTTYSENSPIYGLVGSDDLSEVKGDLIDAYFQAIIDSGVVISATSDDGSILVGGKGNDTFYGGKGTDAVVFQGNKSDYTIIKDGGSIEVIDKIEGRDGTDTLLNIEELKFADISIDYDAYGHGAQVYRIYIATLGRTPDDVGFGYYKEVLDKGFKPSTIVNDFLGSPEFTAKYNSLNNESFVTQIYKNVLDRDPDEGGYNYYVGLLNNNLMSRAYVVLDFSDSGEFSAKLVGAIQNGITFVEYVG